MEAVKYDVLVIAGTTEARAVIENELKAGHRVLAAVATDLGRQMLLEYPIQIREGRLDLDGFVKLLEEERPKKVMDASHPFAEVVTRTVKEACRLTKIPYERTTREEPEYDYENIIWVKDAREAAQLVSHMEGNILLTTGVNTAKIYAQNVKDFKERLYIRVLDNEKSLSGCKEAGFLESHVLGRMPPFSVEDNQELLEKWNIKAMVSKDSGSVGGVPEKVEACRAKQIPLVLIKRPDMLKQIPRIAIAGVNSGCGKTTVTCGILKALADRNVDLQPFKCGPDYIDPMLHSHIAKKACRNLDPFFLEEEELRSLFVKDAKKAEFSVIEGVMGYYDGMGISCEKSTYTVTMATKTPTILVLNAKGMSYTMIPLLEGMIRHKENPIQGVILNRCTKGMYQMMKPLIEEKLGIEAVGYLPPSEEVVIGSRHLGLMTAGEIQNLDQVIAAVGKLAGETIDLDRILEIGNQADMLPTEPKETFTRGETVKIAVAKDNAFCFYYEENLEVLKKLGAELVPFSPVQDKELPKDIAGIYLGGGYPETYQKELAANQEMKNAIRRAVDAKIPLIAECGGFMYVCDQLVDTDGNSYPMAHLVDTNVQMTEKLNMQFGYVTLEAKESNAYLQKGQTVKAHEFHYSRADNTGESFLISKENGRSWEGVHIKDRIWAGYPHLYFRNCMEIAKNFLSMAREAASLEGRKE